MDNKEGVTRQGFLATGLIGLAGLSFLGYAHGEDRLESELDLKNLINS